MDRMPCFELGDVGSIPAGPATTQGVAMKPRMFENVVTREQFLCVDPRDVREIDGVRYLPVKRPGTERVVLIRQEALRPVGSKKTSG